MDSPRILVVDDEPRSVEFLSRALRKIGEVAGVHSASEALERIATVGAEIVVTDQRMPTVTGSELLAQIADEQPHIGRILVTGYADLESTIDAINHGRIHAYLHKPCDLDLLRSTVRGVLERRDLSVANSLMISTIEEQNLELRETLASLRSVQSALVSNERLAAVGKMIAMIAHELRHPLSVVRSASAQLAERGTQDPGLADLAENILAETRHMQGICRELSEVTRVSGGTPLLERCGLTSILDDAARSCLRESAGLGIEVDIQIPQDFELDCDRDRLSRALVNLTNNAIEAMPDGGRLELHGTQEGNLVVIRVIDTGDGVSAAIKNTLFDPFVTLGKPGGTGLGLAVAAKVADDHGGSVTLGKVEGGGACFELRFPRERGSERMTADED